MFQNLETVLLYGGQGKENELPPLNRNMSGLHVPVIMPIYKVAETLLF